MKVRVDVTAMLPTHLSETIEVNDAEYSEWCAEAGEEPSLGMLQEFLKAGVGREFHDGRVSQAVLEYDQDRIDSLTILP